MKETLKIKNMINRGDETITSVADKLGLTRNTIYTRLEKNNWKKSEIALIKSM